MTQRTDNNFTNEIYTEAPRKNYINNKTNVPHIDDTWSLDILDFMDYGPEKK